MRHFAYTHGLDMKSTKTRGTDISCTKHFRSAAPVGGTPALPCVRCADRAAAGLSSSQSLSCSANAVTHKKTPTCSSQVGVFRFYKVHSGQRQALFAPVILSSLLRAEKISATARFSSPVCACAQAAEAGLPADTAAARQSSAYRRAYRHPRDAARSIPYSRRRPVRQAPPPT